MVDDLELIILATEAPQKITQSPIFPIHRLGHLLLMGSLDSSQRYTLITPVGG